MTEIKAPITHDQAMEAALRLIAGAFRRDGLVLIAKERPRFSIPARPEDDDVLLCDYIQQQKDREKPLVWLDPGYTRSLIVNEDGDLVGLQDKSEKDRQP